MICRNCPAHGVAPIDPANLRKGRKTLCMDQINDDTGLPGRPVHGHARPPLSCPRDWSQGVVV